jgi:hypothetical protein
MNNYWNQFDLEEINEMHGVENAVIEELDTDMDQDESDTNLNQNECPKCHNGCNYCLMTGY